MIKQMLKTFLFLAMFFLLPNFSQAAIIFEDNFNDSPDWQSAESYPSTNAGWPNTWKDKPGGPSQPPPQNWTAYSAAIPRWDRGPTWKLDAGGARNSGKGITFAVEAVHTWAGGGLDLYLGNAGYQELYMRGYYKYDPVTFHWPTINNEGINNGNYHKIARISRYQLEPSLVNNPQQFLAPSYQAPTFYPEVAVNTGTGYQNPPDLNAVHFLGARVFDPGAGDASAEDFYTLPMPSDGGWHSYEFRVKMNSAPGVADGEWEVWVDDGINSYQHHKRTGLAWVGADSVNGLSPGWNWVNALDNITINQTGTIYENTEMKIFLDDFVISDSFIGKDYIIGTADITAPAAPTGLGVE